MYISVCVPDVVVVDASTAPVAGLTQLTFILAAGTISVTDGFVTVLGTPVVEFPVAEFNTSRI